MDNLFAKRARREAQLVRAVHHWETKILPTIICLKKSSELTMASILAGATIATAGVATTFFRVESQHG